MTDFDRKDLKPEQARPNNNNIFRLEVIID